MELNLKNKFFIVTGASAGFGKAIAQSLLNEEAEVLLIARNEQNLKLAVKNYPKALILTGDITKEETLEKLYSEYGHKNWDGILINAGGPPAKTFMETTVDDWDTAYKSLLRWKMQLLQYTAKKMMQQKYGRILMIESSTLKHPLQNLVLSNSLRMAVAAMAKTLSRDIASGGVTLNIIAPGYHKTAAVNRIFEKESKESGRSIEEVQKQFEKEIPVGNMGAPEDFASLATWLLSPVARFVTGQVYTVDGGFVRYPL